MDNALLLLMLVAAIGIGWWLGRRERVHLDSPQRLLEAAAAGAGGLSLRDRSPSDLEALAESLRITSQTVETHLELGRLCRRRGEADKAIHIHQRLLESTWLNTRWTMLAKLELARDYHSAGLLDRAEILLLELADEKDPELLEKTGELLLNVYEQERDWEHAIQVCARLSTVGRQSSATVVAHYHCEIAEEALGAGNYRRVERKLAQALQEDADCARALMLAAECARRQGRHADAREYFWQLARRAPDFLSEVMDALVDSFERDDDEAGLVALLREALEQGGHSSVLLLLSELIRRDGDRSLAVHFMASHLQRHPSLQGLQRLVELNLADDSGAGGGNTLNLLHELLQQMNEDRPAYLCGQCGFSGNHLHWYCPRCHGWGLIRPASDQPAIRLPQAH